MANSAKSEPRAPQKSVVSKDSSPAKKSKPEISLPSLEEFLNAGTHFGHRTSRWHPKMSKFIYDERNGVHIIDLVKSMKLLKVALKAIQDASDKGSILVVGTKGQAASMVQKIAEENGAFYVNTRWPGGLFTNYGMIRKSIDKLIKMEEAVATGAEGLVKKEQLMLEREVVRLNKLYEGIKFMSDLPALVILVDTKLEKNALREAKNAKVPVVALVDTNCDPEGVDYIIPSNDDSIKSINLMLDLFAKAIKDGIKSTALIGLRNSHSAKLQQLRKEYLAKVQLKKKVEDEERERLKRLRAGEAVEAESSSKPIITGESGSKTTVRVVEKSDVVAEAKHPLEDSSLSPRHIKALTEAGYKTVEQIEKLSKPELLAVKGIGEKAAEDILKALK